MGMKNNKVDKVTLSVIIPCFNEAETLSLTLESVLGIGEDLDIPVEVVLVDNRSNDGSPEIAESMGAIVVYSDASTVAKVRNDGVAHAKGSIFLFLDADVIIGKSWAERFTSIISTIINERVVVGAHCSVPSRTKGIFREWYLRIQEDSRDTHVGTGHMLVSRNLFSELGGFDPDLSSGEDYDFCKKAESMNCRLLVDQKLVAYHLGYPTKIKEFIERECWHGEGDVVSFKKILSSKVALAAIVFGLLHVLMFISIFLSLEYFLYSSLAFVFFCYLVIYYKFKVLSPASIIKLLPAAYFYLLGRLFSFFRN